MPGSGGATSDDVIFVVPTLERSSTTGVSAPSLAAAAEAASFTYVGARVHCSRVYGLELEAVL
jgi:hypothetical protein